MADAASGALTILLATANDVDAVFALYQSCTAAMLERGVRQWDSGYPDRATAADAADRGDLFLLVDASHMVGSVILNELAAPEYASIVWRAPAPALIVHTLVIEPRRQGGGLGRAAMAACEAFARARGFASVRLDAYPGNAAAIALYERLGYERRGEVHFGFKPPGHERYAVYEKPM
jgi:ribosomal protein S18 acetylase RimI-like enzyme